MSGKPRIYLVIQHVVDAIFQRGVRTDTRYPRIGRFDGELSAHLVFGVVHNRIYQIGFTTSFEPCAESIVLYRDVAVLFLARSTVGNTGLRLRRAGLSNEHTNSNAFVILVGEQLFEIILGALGYFDHLRTGFWWSGEISDYFTRILWSDSKSAYHAMLWLP